MTQIEKITHITDLDHSQAQEILFTIKEEYTIERQKIETALVYNDFKQLLYSIIILHENLILIGEKSLIRFSKNTLNQIIKGTTETIHQSIKKLLTHVDRIMYSA